MPLATVKIFYNQNEVEIAKSSLEAAGIPAVIFHKNINSMAPFLGVAVGGMSLMVSDEDLDDAQGLLALSDDQQSELETESEVFKRNMPSGILGLLTSILFAWMPWWSRDRKYK